MGRPKSKALRRMKSSPASRNRSGSPRSAASVEPPTLPSDLPEQRLLDETIDYIIIIETYLSTQGRSLTGTEQGYAILNKQTGVVEMRFGTYGDALQGLMLCQSHYDEFMAAYKQKMGMLN